MKGADGAAGLLDPQFVRELIGKSDAGETARERVQTSNGITLHGSPADLMAFIHKASQRSADPDVAKAELSTESVNDLDDSEFGYIEPGGTKDDEGKTTPRSLRHFPLNDAAHVRNALSRAPQSPFGGKAMPAIRAAAKKFGIDVAKEAAMAVAAVAKDDAMGPELDDGVDGMDPTVPLAEPDEMGPGDPTVPGSPAWESIDAATAMKWTAILARAGKALEILAEREMLEAASADPDDCENAWDLQDAGCAIDYVISVLAPFAVAEQSEADCCGEEMMAAIGKAMTGFDPAPIAAIEGFAAIRKSGRVLSAANEAHIREAAQRLSTVLSSLPQAPTSDDGQPVAKQKETTVTATDEPVAKETPSAEAQAASAEPVNAGGTAGMGLPSGQEAKPLPGDVPGREVTKAAAPLTIVLDRQGAVVGVTETALIVQRVRKADGDDGAKVPMQAVFDEQGNLVGIVDPADITPVSGAGAKGDDTDPAADAAPAADDTSMTPQPPAETGTPADAVDDDGTVTKEAQDTITVSKGELRSIISDLVTGAVGARETAEDVAKQADVAGLRAKVDALVAEVEVLKEQPAQPKVFTNGQVPPAQQLRGQDQGTGTQITVAKAAEMRAAFRNADPVEQNRLADEMQQAAIGHLAALHGRG
jgi:hypothetical protein